MTEVERAIREAVARTGEPVLLPSPGARFVLLAIDMFGRGLSEERGLFMLFLGPDLPETDDDWSRATHIAYSTIRKWTLVPVPGVHFNHFVTAMGDAVWRVEATALGLSLLQLTLNREGSQIVIEVAS